MDDDFPQTNMAQLFGVEAKRNVERVVINSFS